jgi:hypothetical protein
MWNRPICIEFDKEIKGLEMPKIVFDLLIEQRLPSGDTYAIKEVTMLEKMAIYHPKRNCGFVVLVLNKFRILAIWASQITTPNK